MLIGVFGDIHGNLAALEAVIADGKAQGVNTWVCLGDVAFRGPQPAECIERVAQLVDTKLVAGNTDQWLFQGIPNGFGSSTERMQNLNIVREWTLQRLDESHLKTLQTAPLSQTLSVGDQQAIFFHSSPSSTEAWLPSSLPEDELVPLVTNHTNDIVVYGHIHSAYLRRVGGRTVINAGSVGHPTDGDSRASYLLVRADNGSSSFELRRVPYDLQTTIKHAYLVGMPLAEEYAHALENAASM